MNRIQIIGAIRFPAFLMMWSAGLVLFVGQLYPADAALVRSGADGLPGLRFSQGMRFSEPLSAVPSMQDDQALAEGIERAMDAGDLARGRWQPGKAVAPAPDRRSASSVTVARNARAAEVRPSEPKSEPLQMDARRNIKTLVAEDDKPTNTMPERVADPVAQTKRAARVVLRSSRPADAYPLLMKDVSLGRDDAEYLGLLAVAALQRQLFAEAEVVYRRLVGMDSTNDRWWAGLALAQERQGLSADDAFDEVVKLADDGSRLKQLATDELRRT